MSIKKSLLLTTCNWENGQYESFKMIPVTNDCPYTEVFYDPLARVLVLFAKDKKEHFTVLQKLDEFGHGARKNNKPLVDRHRLESFKEHYIDRPEEIAQFVNLFAINADQYDFQKYLKELVEVPAPRNLVIDPRKNFSTAGLS
jgi:hypothetical protein